MEAVRRCWASLWTARAMAYRKRQGIEHEAVAMGVVVQAMVPADVSGVLFTANPSTAARDELVVNAGFGLGEALVSGEVTPDTYVLDRESLEVKETRIGTKEVMVVPVDGQRTTTLDVPEARRGEPALSGTLLGELGAMEGGWRSTSAASRRTSSGRWPTEAFGCYRRDPSPTCPRLPCGTCAGSRPSPAVSGCAGRWSSTCPSRSPHSSPSSTWRRAWINRRTISPPLWVTWPGSTPSVRTDHRPGEHHPLAGGLRGDGAGYDPGLSDHHVRLDAALLAGKGTGHRHRRRSGARLYRGARVRQTVRGGHPGRDGEATRQHHGRRPRSGDLRGVRFCRNRVEKGGSFDTRRLACLWTRLSVFELPPVCTAQVKRGWYVVHSAEGVE